MARPRKLTNPEDIAAARVMWLAKIKRKIIGKRFGVGRETLRRLFGKLPQNPDGGVMGQDGDSPRTKVAQ